MSNVIRQWIKQPTMALVIKIPPDIEITTALDKLVRSVLFTASTIDVQYLYHLPAEFHDNEGCDELLGVDLIEIIIHQLDFTLSSWPSKSMEFY